jgi:hypothetical protein
MGGDIVIDILVLWREEPIAHGKITMESILDLDPEKMRELGERIGKTIEDFEKEQTAPKEMGK